MFKYLLLKIKQWLCKHDYGAAVIDEETKADAPWFRERITIPGTGIDIHAEVRRYPVSQTCGKCGHVLISEGKDMRNTPEQCEEEISRDEIAATHEEIRINQGMKIHPDDPAPKPALKPTRFRVDALRRKEERRKEK